jgi:hypothetical protein
MMVFAGKCMYTYEAVILNALFGDTFGISHHRKALVRMQIGPLEKAQP